MWWLILAAVLVAALAYGYWDHTNVSRHLARRLKVVAAKRRGQMTPAGLFTLPQLRFQHHDCQVLVTAMASSGTGNADHGPFTLVSLERSGDGGEKLQIERSRLKSLAAAIAPDRHPKTGQEAFDKAFHLTGGDAALVSRLLTPEFRQILLDSRLPGLDLRVAGRRISAHMDGFPSSSGDLEALIEIALHLADRVADRH